MSRPFRTVLPLWLVLACAGAPGPTPAPPIEERTPPAVPAGEDPSIWEGEVAALEAAASAASARPVVFLGSSSIRLWDSLADDMAPLPVVRQGFGGSRLFDAVYYADRLVVALDPSVVVVFSGTNDLAGPSPKSPERLEDLFVQLVERLRTGGCEAPLVYIAISPTPARAEHAALVAETNRRIADRCAADPGLTFVDTAAGLVDANGDPDPRWFQDDRLHLNPDGYAYWTELVRPVVLALHGGSP